MCGLKIYLDIYLVYNIASEYIQIFVCVHFMIIAHHCLQQLYGSSTPNIFFHQPVMSRNRIFKYSNKMAIKYYLYLYSCYFPSTNIFRYSFVDFWTTQYIQIFVSKLTIWIYLNICLEPCSYICLSYFFMKKWI